MPDYTPDEDEWFSRKRFWSQEMGSCRSYRPNIADPCQVYEQHSTKYSQTINPIVSEGNRMEVTKALAALQPLYGKGNIEIVTRDGHRVRGVVRSMKTTQALTTPSVKVERADGEIVKVPFSSIVEIINYNPPA